MQPSWQFVVYQSFTISFFFFFFSLINLLMKITWKIESDIENRWMWAKKWWFYNLFEEIKAQTDLQGAK